MGHFPWELLEANFLLDDPTAQEPHPAVWRCAALRSLGSELDGADGPVQGIQRGGLRIRLAERSMASYEGLGSKVENSPEIWFIMVI